MMQGRGSTAYLRFPAEVGGVPCVVGDVAGALDCLAAAPGIMVRQPLARHGSPLADCDYHREAAPYRDYFAASLDRAGRGAAGRHITKLAFCYALELVVVAARATTPIAAFAGLTQRAWAAFASDSGYAEEMAKAAVALLRRSGHTVGMRLGDTDAGRGTEPALELEVVAV